MLGSVPTQSLSGPARPLPVRRLVYFREKHITSASPEGLSVRVKPLLRLSQLCPASWGLRSDALTEAGFSKVLELGFREEPGDHLGLVAFFWHGAPIGLP